MILYTPFKSSIASHHVRFMIIALHDVISFVFITLSALFS